MKKLFYSLFLLMAFATAGLAQSQCVDVEEIDGSPRAPCIRELKVTNGTLSCPTVNRCTLTISGGGGGTPGGSAGQVQWNDTGSFGGSSGATATATTFTIVNGVSATFSNTSALVSATNSADSASVQIAIWQGDRATFTSNDEAYHTFRLSNDAGSQVEVARLTWAIFPNTAGTEGGRLDFSVAGTGSLAKVIQLSPGDLSPSNDNAVSLGENGTLQWSDLFLGSGGVISFDNSNVVLTHSAGILTMGTGELRITTVGTNAASVPTLASSSTLSNKTLATGTIFAGYSDLTEIAAPANPSAGSIRLFADSGTGDLGCLDSAGGNCLPAGSSGITVGTTTVTSGTATRLFYETAGNVVGQITGVTSDGASITALPVAGVITQTSNSATAFQSGPNGGTNPVFRLVNSVASAATGLSITGNAAGSHVTLSALSSGATENIILAYKGSAGVQVGTAGPVLWADGSNLGVGTGNGNYGKAVTAYGWYVGSPTTGIAITTNGSGGAHGVRLNSTSQISWSSTSDAFAAADLMIRRAAAANLAFGAADAASPVAQTLSVQNVVAGTTDTAGAHWTHNASRGTGTGAGGDIIFQTAPAGTTGSSQNALAAAFTVRGNGAVMLKSVTFTNLPSVADGYLIYCSDCTIASPCASGGTGALAKGIASAWVCN